MLYSEWCSYQCFRKISWIHWKASHKITNDDTSFQHKQAKLMTTASLTVAKQTNQRWNKSSKKRDATRAHLYGHDSSVSAALGSRIKLPYCGQFDDVAVSDGVGDWTHRSLMKGTSRQAWPWRDENRSEINWRYDDESWKRRCRSIWE